MKYRRLGKTELNVSVIGIGTYQYGGEWGKDFTAKEVAGILNGGKENGINLIDTAECYGDHLAEQLVGEAIYGSRQDWVIATKFGHKFLSSFERERLWSDKDVLKQLDDSLKALKTDYIDLYLFHSSSLDEMQNDALWTMLEKQKAAGKIGHIGLSLHKNINANVLETKYAVEHGIAVIELLYNRIDRELEDKVFSMCIENDIGVMARVPLASGLLSGKYKPGVQFIKSDVRSKQDRAVLDARLTLVEEIRKNEVPKGTDMAEWAIGWCLQHDAVSACIPGFKNIEHMMSGIRSAELEMVSPTHPQSVSKLL